MSIVLELTPTEEASLSILARRGGVAPEEMAVQLVREALEQNRSDAAENPLLAKLAQWQTETRTQTTLEIPTRELFDRWAREDANMTDEERQAEDGLWENFETGINENRAALRMRQL